MQFLNVETTQVCFCNICFPKGGDLSIQKLYSKSIYLSELLNFLTVGWPVAPKRPIKKI